jgi:hypothetical protein
LGLATWEGKTSGFGDSIPEVLGFRNRLMAELEIKLGRKK